jgi:hypothetical protein
MYHKWLYIKQGANTINFRNNLTSVVSSIVIPDGTYPYQQLSIVINALMGDVGDCIYVKERNIMLFTFSTEYTLWCDSIGKILGFIEGEEYVGMSIASLEPMTPLDITYILVHLNNISPVNDSVNLTNIGGQIKMSSIIGKILVNSAPFQLISHQGILESEGTWSNDNTLQQLEFLLTDEDGVELVDCPEHELTLQIQVYELEDKNKKRMYDDIRKIKELMTDMFLMKSLRQRNLM